MLKKSVLILMVSLLLHPPLANAYIGGGFGLGEACNTKNEPSFFDGDCRKPGIVLRGVAGKRANEYLFAELSAEGLISPWKLFGLSDVEEQRVSAFTIGGHTFLNLPLTRSFHLYAGPSLGASVVHTSWDEGYQYNTTTQKDETITGSDYDYSWNYGWAAGIEFINSDGNVAHIQWQNWRALESDIAYGGEVNTNYITFNFISRF